MILFVTAVEEEPTFGVSDDFGGDGGDDDDFDQGEYMAPEPHQEPSNAVALNSQGGGGGDDGDDGDGGGDSDEDEEEMEDEGGESDDGSEAETDMMVLDPDHVSMTKKQLNSKCLNNNVKN